MKLDPPLTGSAFCKNSKTAQGSAHTRGEVPATTPGDRASRLNYPFSSQNVVAATKFWSPAISPTKSNWFEFVGLVAGTLLVRLVPTTKTNKSGFAMRTYVDFHLFLIMND